MEQLLWAIVGAAIGLLGQAGYELAGQLRLRAGLFGKWHSTWQPTAVAGWDWVTDTVSIRRGIFGIHLTNAENSAGYEWQGKAKLIDNTYLIGQWVSRKPGSNAEGVFSLTFGTDGNYLLGFFLGRDLDRGKVASGFVLGRTPEDCQVGRKKLEAMRVRFPRSEPRTG